MKSKPPAQLKKMNILRRKIVLQVFSIGFFFSSLALMTHFVAKTILVRRRKTGKSGSDNTRMARGFSPTDFIPSDVLPFSLDQDESLFDANAHISEETKRLDEVMSPELKVKRAILRLQIALDEITCVSTETFPNPEISARVLEGIFNFMRKKVRFAAWLEVLKVCQRPGALDKLFQRCFEYLAHTLPRDIEENPTVFDNFDLSERLMFLIKTVKSTPTYAELAENRIFQYLLVDFEMMTAPPHMLRRQESLLQYHQVTHYISMMGVVCAFKTTGSKDKEKEKKQDTPDDPFLYISNKLERESHRALALLRLDFDIWGRMTASRRALEISQRKDVDFAKYNLLSESLKASKMIKTNKDKDEL